MNVVQRGKLAADNLELNEHIAVIENLVGKR